MFAAPRYRSPERSFTPSRSPRQKRTPALPPCRPDCVPPNLQFRRPPNAAHVLQRCGSLQAPYLIKFPEQQRPTMLTKRNFYINGQWVAPAKAARLPCDQPVERRALRGHLAWRSGRYRCRRRRRQGRLPGLGRHPARRTRPAGGAASSTNTTPACRNSPKRSAWKWARPSTLPCRLAGALPALAHQQLPQGLRRASNGSARLAPTPPTPPSRWNRSASSA